MSIEDILKIKDKIKHNLNYTGMDNLNGCLNKEHFINYKKKVIYNYNSQGFRDEEWPTDLNDVIWCVGDSFTVGIGQPYKETWPFLLEKNIKKRCLNLGEDGCSNDTISLRVKEINKLYKPKLIIVMWSYLHRRRVENKNVHVNKKDFGPKKDLKNFKKNFIEVNTLDCKIINLLIPNILALETNSKDFELTRYILKKLNLKKNDLKEINVIPQLDYARDYHHFDIKTSEYVVDVLIKTINNFDFYSK